jgi:hypothetical protein
LCYRYAGPFLFSPGYLLGKLPIVDLFGVNTLLSLARVPPPVHVSGTLSPACQKTVAIVKFRISCAHARASQRRSVIHNLSAAKHYLGMLVFVNRK